MNKITGWIINNVKEALTGNRLEEGIPFAIWQRQWEICDVTGARARAGDIAQKIRSLSQRNPVYAMTAGLYLSQLFIYRGEYKKALEPADECLSLAAKLSDSFMLAKAYEQLSSAHQNLSNFDQAAEHTQKAIDIYSTGKDDLRLASSLASLGRIYWKTGQYPEALSVLDQARQIFQKNNDDRSLALVFMTIANVMLATDEPKQAQDYYLSALSISQRIGDLAKQSTLHNNLGGSMLNQAEYSIAMEHYNLGLKIDETLGNLHGQASKLCNIAVMQASVGNHDQALANFEKALKIERDTGNQDGQMRKLGNLATLYSIKNDYPKATVYIDEALDICQKIQSRSYYEFYLIQKVGYLGNTKDYRRAKAIGKEALELSLASGNQGQLATLYSSLADIYYDTGDIEKAFEYSSQAIEIIGKHELFEVYKEDSYFTHCRILEKQGRQKESDKYLGLAYNEVQTKARNIRDEEERKGFLTKNKTIAAIVEKWEISHSKET
ncbi:tetratricopeptide repeat protein [candidate division TA06 bacterium]|uniref:Tetratricopeptide repeat protein n=1 Tax=candidate division TA06 bacterium TaxID=2250710 RepID=A0A933MK62_UNCT6|nr:tetratricopeptide repeat protein [candidate division TA06 bacterium]